ncbi:hypothetical protein [Actinomadura roseirufa]|uniref:hypothetical protein n=1 Tax=Actinomadura roseirufa TaxID=2094049 RepID=UPI0013F15D8D|nr:hypothetical protein [Actinomadura roseirufa]
MPKDELARRRVRYTGQAHQHALNSVRRDGREHSAIPVARPPQSFLEALALERIGDWNPAFWAHNILGVGLAWVDPAPNGIALGCVAKCVDPGVDGGHVNPGLVADGELVEAGGQGPVVFEEVDAALDFCQRRNRP